MKKIALLIFALSVCQFISYGQEDVSLDQMLVNVNKSSVTSGIIYERTATFANLYKYNTALDTADIVYFEQAENELYDASNQTKFVSNDALRQLYSPSSQASVVDIGILNSQYQILNYDSINPSNGGLTLSNNLFYVSAGSSCGRQCAGMRPGVENCNSLFCNAGFPLEDPATTNFKNLL